MSRNRKRILALIVAAALLIAAAGGFFAWYTGVYNNYSRYIALGERCLAENDYDNSVLAYQRAIRIDPERTDAYLGLARTYQSGGRTALAESTLRMGIERTGSARMTLMLETLWDDGAPADGASDAGKEPSVLTLDTSLLSLFGNSTFNDYRLRNGIESVSAAGGACRVRVTGLSATLWYSADELEHTGNQPMPDSYPVRIELDDLSRLFGGVRTVTAGELRGIGVSTAELTEGENGTELVFTASGCRVAVAAGADGRTLEDGAHSIEVLTDAMGAQNAQGAHVEGQVISSVTGGGVSRAEVLFRSGSETVGEPVLAAVTDSFGRYTAALATGRYTAEVRCEGYVTDYFEVYVGSGSVTNAGAFSISPQLAEGQVRIVLEWGSTPSDLDSWLDGALDDGTQVHVNFTNRSASNGQGRVAELDLDDTNGYGPETTTIYNLNGKFTFKVHDYTESGRMSSSGATVKIYMPGAGQPETISVPAGLGNDWYVCTIDHGELTVTNHG